MFSFSTPTPAYTPDLEASCRIKIPGRKSFSSSSFFFFFLLTLFKFPAPNKHGVFPYHSLPSLYPIRQCPPPNQSARPLFAENRPKYRAIPNSDQGLPRPPMIKNHTRCLPFRGSPSWTDNTHHEREKQRTFFFSRGMKYAKNPKIPPPLPNHLPPSLAACV